MTEKLLSELATFQSACADKTLANEKENGSEIVSSVCEYAMPGKLTPAVPRVYDRMRKASANVWDGFMMRLSPHMVAAMRQH